MTALVIGAAVSGRAAARLLRSQGQKVIVYDADPAAIVGVDADLIFGGVWDPSLLDGVDLVVPSPGVPEHAPPIADALAAGVTVWSELELGYRNVRVPILAVTATNGKTTVTELAAAMLAESGLRAAAVGNIGEPLSGVDDREWDVLVVEASSFQLRFVETFHAAAAVLLNLAPTTSTGTARWLGTPPPQRVRAPNAKDIVVFDVDDQEPSSPSFRPPDRCR